MLIKQLLIVLTGILLFAPSADSGQEIIKDYSDARVLFWSKLYQRGGKTLYCADTFSGRYRNGLNIEHVFPMSWVTKDLRCGRRKECRSTSPEFNRIEADLHNLFPARRAVNDARRSFRFGVLQGEPRRFGDCDFEADEARRVVEPAPAARGEIARAMLYMNTEYDLTIFRRLGELLKKWNKQDRPSKHEKWRNDQIERIQGTRNPFIDNPNLAEDLRF